MGKQPTHKQQNVEWIILCSKNISVYVGQASWHFGEHTKERKGARFTFSRIQVKHKAWNATFNSVNQSIKLDSDYKAQRMQEEMKICHNHKKIYLSSNMWRPFLSAHPHMWFELRLKHLRMPKDLFIWFIISTKSLTIFCSVLPLDTTRPAWL